MWEPRDSSPAGHLHMCTVWSGFHLSVSRQPAARSPDSPWTHLLVVRGGHVQRKRIHQNSSQDNQLYGSIWSLESEEEEEEEGSRVDAPEAASASVSANRES